MIADAARTRLSCVIVMYGRGIVPSLLFAPPVKLNVANLVVEDYHLLCTSCFLEQLLNLGIIDFLHFCPIVKVLYCRLMMNQLKSLLVERQLFKPSITDQN